MSSKKWDEITYPYPNLNGSTVDVWEWISNFISRILIDVITYPSGDKSWSMLIKGHPEVYIATMNAHQRIRFHFQREVHEVSAQRYCHR